MQRYLALLCFVFMLVVTVRSACTEGDVRLNATDNRARDLVVLGVAAGRVEVCLSGRWSTVCSTGFGSQEASVVCRQLGYLPGDATLMSNAAFGEGQGPILQNPINCHGNEHKLVNCSQSAHPANCTHAKDVGVVCQVPGQSCRDGEVILIGGSTRNKGTVQMCFNKQYGVICGTHFNSSAASVICGTLRYSRENAIAIPHTIYSIGIGLPQSVSCNGTEHNVTQCIRTSTPNCPQSNHAALLCKPPIASCKDGLVRLVNGTNRTVGRVEICFNGEWGRVCGSNWGVKEAGVVCRQLGYMPGNLTRLPQYGKGIGFSLLDQTVCRGNETSLLSCSHAQIGSRECTYSTDASAVCVEVPPCVNGSVRLQGGKVRNEGRVEVCIGGAWGTICDQGWNSIAASVVCNQLGFTITGTGSAIAIPHAWYGEGTGRILFDHISCHGNESSLLRCTHPATLSRTCTHSNDAGVLCPVASENCCRDGDVRLANGTSSNEGRVEVCFNCVWATVCDSGWRDSNAQVVCRQLGFNGLALATAGDFFPGGTTVTLLDAVDCRGNEPTILHCRRKEVGQSSCTRRRDAGVICQVHNLSSSVCTTGAIRLVGSALEIAGTVEVCINNRWSTVCDNHWDSKVAKVVCRQLGFNSSLAVAVFQSQFGEGSGRVLLSNVRCAGNESNVFDCPRGATLAQGCSTHHQDGGVICTALPCKDGALSLVDGMDKYSGRLEVCNGGQWGTVCGKGVSNDLANTACGLLGFDSKGAVAIGNAIFGKGSGRTYTLLKSCLNQSNTICTLSVNSSGESCSHLDDLSIMCTPALNQFSCSIGDVRLIGGVTNGRVEVCLGGQWGTVCDDSWTDNGAKVVCKQLGLPSDHATTISTKYEYVQGPIALSRVKCEGNENSLLNCQLVSIAAASRHYCTHSNDVFVTCPAMATSSSVSVLLPSAIVNISAVVSADLSSVAKTAAITVPVVLVMTLAAVMVIALVVLLLMYRAKRTTSREFEFKEHSDKQPVITEDSCAPVTEANGLSSPKESSAT